VLLRMLREPRTGQPAPFTRLLALVLILTMLGLSAIPLLVVVRWVVSLL
jgi:hypothetical protein